MSKRVFMFIAFVLAFAVAGCAGTPTVASPPVVADGAAIPAGTTNAQAERIVFTAKSTYQTVLTAAVAYKNLRPCSATVTAPCSDPAIVAQMQKADTVAGAAIDAAEAAVRVPSLGTSARDKAIQTANSALAALSVLVSSIGGI